MHHAHIDKFAYQDSAIHRLDSRVKFLVVLVFTAVVISLPRSSLSILACYAIGPFAILVWAGIPLKFVFKQILLVSPFVIVLALSCPLYDRTPVAVSFGPFSWQSSLGWLRCFVILGKFIVTMLALIALVSTTRFSDLLAGLQKLGMPRLLIIQLGFLYRYIFVLIDRAHHILRARAGRKLRNLGFKTELRTAASMLGSLFIRSIDTAEHISIAMQARGFDGSWRTLSKLKVRGCDLFFALTAAAFMSGLYFFVKPILQ
ncbi:MAG TPA: cobalt ECF transporter T component CbiQ [Sedimentisphaerales bacterium]|nr:cobalt ECF transporter T component CbiQ [Sedimentisphaerales bacterium]